MEIEHSTGLRPNTSGLPLFLWANTRAAENLPSKTPDAARRIASRFGLPPRRARVIAELAGYSLDNHHA